MAHHKKCMDCKQSKEIVVFGVRRDNKDGRQARCRECMRARRAERAEHLRKYDRARRGRTAPQRWDRDLRQKYGINAQAYDAMLASQGGACAICHEVSEQRLAVDHCHVTRKVRGLLCSRCNVGLGMFQDNSQRMRAAIQYLGSVA